MKKFKIYLDTSVIGGCFDPEFEKWSNALFNEIKAGNLTGVISNITAEELIKAPLFVQDNFYQLPRGNIETISVNDEMRLLAEKYLNSKIVSDKFKEDCLHIAAATISNVDILVSWNFKHIVNFQKIRLFNFVNTSEGYKVLDIRTPLEVINAESND